MQFINSKKVNLTIFKNLNEWSELFKINNNYKNI